MVIAHKAVPRRTWCCRDCVWQPDNSPACEEDACAGLGCFLGRSCSLKSTSMLHNGKAAYEASILLMLAFSWHH